MKRLMHIAVNTVGRELRGDEWQPMLNKALDWVRYAPNCWIVLTTAGPDVWYQRVKTFVNDSDGFLVCEINASGEFSGFLPAYVWDWLARVTQQELHALPAPKPDSP